MGLYLHRLPRHSVQNFYIAMDEFSEFLNAALAGQLPGPGAQQRMAPRNRDGSVRTFIPPPTARQSAVAVVITQTPRPAVLLTLRSSNLRHHRGQISFPGGRIEHGESPVDAAMRELREEVAIPPSDVRVLGTLSKLYTPPSNSAIVPVVMEAEQMLTCVPDPVEVEEWFWVQLDQLLGTAVEEEWELPYGRMIVPHWRIHPRVPLWGATAMILSELLELYEGWLSKRATLQAQASSDRHRQ
jgi:mutator protein MutT